jgi:subtilisin family serine protease
MNFVRAVGVLSVTAAVVSSLVGVTTVPVAVPAAEPTSAFIVELAPGETALDVSSEVAEDLNTDIQIDETFDTLLDGFSAELTPTEVEALQASPDVLAVYPDLPMSINATQTNAPWNLSRLDQDTAPADSTYTYPDSAGSGARIYVVDTGVSANPAQFGSRLLRGFTAISDGWGTAECAGSSGHGTHVAGTAASTSYGVAKRATIVPVRVFGCTGSTDTSTVIVGLDWITRNHPVGTPGIVNLSLGSSALNNPSAPDALSEYVNRMSDQGFVMVVAAGNNTDNACNYSPARAAKALTVAATTSTDARSGFSNFGACVDMFAPGSDIRSLQWNNPSGSTVMSGTSMAAPHVAGAVAVLMASTPGLSASQAQSRLLAEARVGVISDVGPGSPTVFLSTAFLSSSAIDPLQTRQSFVRALYQDFLGRAPSINELSNWTSRLTTGQIDSYGVAAELSRSDEWISKVLTGYYRNTLNREPDAQGLRHWINAARSGMSVSQIAAFFYGSPEYFATVGQSNHQIWITDLYQKLLLRAPDPVGLKGWVNALNTGVPRHAVAFGFYQSPETLGLRVNTLYRTFLGREGEPEGIAHWTPFVAKHGDLVLAAALAGSQEYFNRSQLR